MFSLSDAIAQLIFIGIGIIIGWAIFSLRKLKKEKIGDYSTKPANSLSNFSIKTLKYFMLY